MSIRFSFLSVLHLIIMRIIDTNIFNFCCCLRTCNCCWFPLTLIKDKHVFANKSKTAWDTPFVIQSLTESSEWQLVCALRWLVVMGLWCRGHVNAESVKHKDRTKWKVMASLSSLNYSSEHLLHSCSFFKHQLESPWFPIKINGCGCPSKSNSEWTRLL